MSEDRIEKSALLPVPRARVWRALSNARSFGEWFGVILDGEFAPGARLRGRITGYEDHPFEIAVERVEPERLLSWRWHPHAIDLKVDYSAEPPTLVQFELEDAANGALLKVTESGFSGIPIERRQTAYNGNEQGWAIQMKSIAQYLTQPHSAG